MKLAGVKLLNQSYFLHLIIELLYPKRSSSYDYWFVIYGSSLHDCDSVYDLMCSEDAHTVGEEGKR